MRVEVLIRYRANGRTPCTSLGPVDIAPCEDNDMRGFAAEQARSMFSDRSMFALDVDKKQYFVVMPAVRRERASDVFSDEFVCDVYCVMQSDCLRVIDLVTKLKDVFQLTGVSEERVIPWSVGHGSECSVYYSDKGFGDCTTNSDTVYRPGSVFLISGDSDEQSSTSWSSSCGSVVYSPPAYGGIVEEFKEAHRETDNPHGTSSEHSLVGISFPTRPLAPKGPSKSDLTRRDPASTQPALITTDVTSPPIQPHKNLVGGGGTPATPRKPSRKEGFYKVQSQKDLFQAETPTAVDLSHLSESLRPQTPVTNMPLRLEASNGALKVSDDRHSKTCGDDCNTGEKGGKEEREEGKDSSNVGRRSSAPNSFKIRTSLDRRTQLTNGVNLPRVSINPSDGGESILMVAGVDKLSEIPQETCSGASTSKHNEVSLQKRRNSSISAQSSPEVHTLRKSTRNRKQHSSRRALFTVPLGTALDTELRRMHALEHACNGPEGPCHLSNEKHLVLCVFDKELVSEMHQCLREYEGGATMSQDIRELIIRHSGHCKDSRCKVPHLAAGCSPAGVSFCTPSASHPNSSRETLSLRSSPSLSSPSSHTPLPPSLFSSTRVMLSDNPLPPYEARATANVDFNPYPANICQSPAPLLPPGEIATTSYDEQPAVICQSPAPLLPPEGVAIDSLVLQPANSSQSPPPLLLYKGIAAVSVDIQPANISHSPTPLLSPKGIGTVSFDLQPANISESPPPPFSPKGIAAVSFDVQAANVSESPTHRKPTSPTRTSSHQATRRPTTLNTQSDSPRHHVTHLPTVHSRQVLPGSINGVMVIPQMHVPPNQFENTFLQGTFTPRRPCNVVPNERPLPSVAQATEDERMAHGQPRPHPVSSSERPPDIWRSNFPGKFPPARQLEPETVIFSRFGNVIRAGSKMPLSCLEMSPSLGKGGNGVIFKHWHPLLNKRFAIKRTLYRAGELTEWQRFDHVNVMKLLMMCTYTTTTRCLQFMELMDGSLSREVHEVCYNGVTSLYQQQMGRSGCQQLMSNARHILRCVVTGIAYLHEELYIQHADLKASNVLIKKLCCCANIFMCECHDDDKCLVKLSDFDSVKPFPPLEVEDIATYWDRWYIPMSPKECGDVMGTPGYRAPEQFWKLAQVIPPDHFLFGRSLEGPWTDIWSLGHICLTVFLGPNKPEDRQEAWTMSCRSQGKEFSRTDIQPELNHPLLRLAKLNEGSMRHSFTDVYDFTSHCFKTYFDKRPTARQLLSYNLLSKQ